MPQPTYKVFLECAQCQNVEFADAEALLVRLRSLGMMRRNAEPDNDLIKEMVERMSDGFRCVTCGNVGLTTSDVDPFDDEAWGQARKCEKCRAPIPSERLEIFPDTRRCMACQSKDESSDGDDAEFDYCSQCGDIRQLRARTGGGVAGYRMYCPTCRR